MFTLKVRSFSPSFWKSDILITVSSEMCQNNQKISIFYISHALFNNGNFSFSSQFWCGIEVHPPQMIVLLTYVCICIPAEQKASVSVRAALYAQTWSRKRSFRLNPEFYFLPHPRGSQAGSCWVSFYDIPGVPVSPGARSSWLQTI